MTGVDRNRKTRRQLLGLGVLGLGGVLTACAAPNRKSSEGVPGTPPGRSGASAPLTSPITLVLIHGAWHQPGPTWLLTSSDVKAFVRWQCRSRAPIHAAENVLA